MCRAAGEICERVSRRRDDIQVFCFALSRSYLASLLLDAAGASIRLAAGLQSTGLQSIDIKMVTGLARVCSSLWEYQSKTMPIVLNGWRRKF